MKRSVALSCATSSSPLRRPDSSVRTVVVPTAITRCALLILSAARCEMEKRSACMRCSAISSERTGRNVPVPTCRVTNVCGISFKISGVK